MTKMTLYTGRGVSYSPEYADGRTESDYVRLVADDGMMLTDGETAAVCIDVPASDAERWSEIAYAEPGDEADAADYESALLQRYNVNTEE